MSSKVTKTCFIIMPITTPKDLVETYNNDPDHFEHVMEVLFIPAVEAAGLKPIKPIAKGSDLIQGGIIKNIQTADMVLCDMSILNANVFFELGMRTAINQPVALVLDTATSRAPFDLSMINHHKYNHELRAWELDDQVRKLKVHLEDCLKNAEEGNSLWNHLGVTIRADPLEGKPGTESQFELINRQLEDLRKRVSRQEPMHFSFGSTSLPLGSGSTESMKELAKDVIFLTEALGIRASILPLASNELLVSVLNADKLPTNAISELERAAMELGVKKGIPVKITFS